MVPTRLIPLTVGTFGHMSTHHPDAGVFAADIKEQLLVQRMPSRDDVPWQKNRELR